MATGEDTRPRLNQMLAVVKGVKGRSESILTKMYHTLQRVESATNSPLNGLSRKYEPLNADDPGEERPDETTLVQFKVEDSIKEVTKALVTMFDAVATLEVGNTHTKVDLVVNGTVIMENVPSTYLLFLDKQLTDIYTFVSKLPTLPLNEDWHWDADHEWFATNPVKTRATKKVMRNHVVAKATDKHPEQVQVYQEDTTVGFWLTRKFSGAIPNGRKKEVLDRIDALQQAVRKAREEANSIKVDQIKVGDKVFSYLFA